MTIELNVEENSLIVLRISGIQSQKADAALGKQLLKVGEKLKEFKILVLLDGFKGWASEAWDDMKLVEQDAKLSKYIKKIAFVGDKRWEEAIEIFTGFSSDTVHYYSPPTKEAEARNWLLGE